MCREPIETGEPMATYGYARVSTDDQHLAHQIERLTAAGCEHVRHEKVSGTNREGRDELRTLLAFLRAGDTLMVTRIDRLARSLEDLLGIVRDLNARGVALRTTDQSIDTGSTEGKLFLSMLGAFAEFETNIRRERQMEGIAKAKARGVYKGRKPSVDRNKVREMHSGGVGPAEIARSLGISRASVYRALDGS